MAEEELLALRQDEENIKIEVGTTVSQVPALPPFAPALRKCVMCARYRGALRP